jgi:hypothetical protein
MEVYTEQMGVTIQKFIKTVDEHFIKPKKEEYYDLVKHFKYCKQVIKDINCRKKIRRISIREWLWTWIVFFCRKPRSAFFILKNTKKDSEYFVKDYWMLKSAISDIDQCINELDNILDQFELLGLKMKTFDKKFETMEKEINKIEGDGF